MICAVHSSAVPIKSKPATFFELQFSTADCLVFLRMLISLLAFVL